MGVVNDGWVFDFLRYREEDWEGYIAAPGAVS